MLMLQEIIHALIQRIMHDKIILGLIVIGLLAAFMSGMNSKEDPAVSGKHGENAKQASLSEQPQAQAPAPGPAVEPALARDFVRWWLGMAMDYSAQTAAQNHQQAYAWMSRDAMVAFQSIYWSPELADSIVSGRTVAAFQPAVVQARAINPDGSVVVGVQGTYILQNGPQPVPYQIRAQLLVRRAKDGLRIAGIYNEMAAAVPGRSIY